MSSTFYSSDATLEENKEFNKNSEDDYIPSLEETWTAEEISKCRKWIEDNKYTRIALQFPDNLLEHSVTVYEDLKKDTEVECFILGDTSYGCCCVDEVAASHVEADALIHFGRACMSKNSRLPVLYIFPRLLGIDLKDCKGKIEEISREKEESVVIFLDCGYSYVLPQIQEIFKDQKNVTIAETHKNLREDLKNHISVFVGEDDQTFFNLSLSRQAREWYLYSAKEKDFRPTSYKTSTWFRRRFYYVEVCKDAKMIGIIMGTLTTAGYLEMAKKIQTLASDCGKKTILISVGKINPAKLANFQDVDCFILIGCPENDVYNSREFFKPLLTPFEVELALNPAWKDTLPETYCVDFSELLENGQHFREYDPKDIYNGQENDVSLITGRIRYQTNGDEAVSSEKSGSELLERSSGALVSNRITEAFQERSWRGLDPSLGQHEPAKIVPGRSGIPLAYDDQNDSKK
ncbi:2-(3-amino-3-carboxypropyl)histidine synthase subunit 2 [Sergentomyia squamirostris]